MPKISLQREIGLEKELLSNKLQNRVKDYHSSTKNRRCACGDCEECYRDFAYFLHIFSDDQSIPQISAKSWCIWRKKNGRFAYYYGKRIHKVREIASLSKMITAMTAIDVLTRYSIDPSRIKYEIHKTSIMVGGTTANLEIGQVVSLLDLFYGMMLPSGNDAAVAISEAIGLIQFLKSRNKPFEPYSDNWY